MASPSGPRSAVARRAEALLYLPCAPSTRLALLKLARAEMLKADDIVVVVRRDPGFAARIISVANAGGRAGGRPRGIDTAAAACYELGLVDVLNVLRQIPERPEDGEERIDTEALQKHAILAGLAARIIANATGFPNVDRLATAALLHGIGRLALDEAAPGKYASLPGNLTAREFLAAEQSLFKTTHTDAGAALAAAWHLPRSLVDSIRFHRDAELITDKKRPIHAIGLAVLVADLAEATDSRVRDAIGSSAAELCGMLGMSPPFFEVAQKAAHEAALAEQREFERVVSDEPMAMPIVLAPPVEPVPIPPEAEEAAAGTSAFAARQRGDGAQGPLDLRQAFPATRRARNLETEARFKLAFALMGFALAGAMLYYIYAPQAAPSAAARSSASNSPNGAAAEVNRPAAVKRPFDRTRADELQEEIGQLTRTLQEAPASAEAASTLMQIANIYSSELNDCGTAETYYQQVISDYPAADSVQDAYIGLAGCYLQLGRKEDAQWTMQQLMKTLAPGSPEYLAMEELLEQMKNGAPEPEAAAPAE